MQNLQNIDETIHKGKRLLCAAFFEKYGFSKPIRHWEIKWQQFAIYYTIEGYDCTIIVRPVMQIVPSDWNAFGEGVHEMPPELQVEEFSDIIMLQDHHIGDYQVFVNKFDNHVATFNYEYQMLDFMSICDCPLTCK